jgi:hypothetical protein
MASGSYGVSQGASSVLKTRRSKNDTLMTLTAE